MCRTKAVEIMVQEIQRVGLEDGDIRTIETGMREMLRAVEAQHSVRWDAFRR